MNKETTHPAWKRQRALKKQDIPSQATLLATIQSTYTSPQDKALFTIAYLTGGRITEVVQCPHLYHNIYTRIDTIDKEGNPKKVIKRNKYGSPIIQSTERIPHNYLGICKKDITTETIKGKNIMIITMQNRKNKNYTRKSIPISIDKEKDFVQIIHDYIINLEEYNPLFPYGRAKAETIITKTGMNPHFLRDIRLTHLVTIYDFREYQLTKFAGWKDSRPAERYIRLAITDLIDKY
jgi:hypothetical protein